MPHLTRIALFVCALTTPAYADAVSDALKAANDAYAAGKLNTAAAQIRVAGNELSTLQSAMLTALFPPAPEGWARIDNADMAQGLAMIGGGAGAEATYTDAAGMTVTLSAYADNAMVQTFVGLLADPQMMAMMGKTVDINGVTFLEQEGSNTMALLDSRVLLQASGDAAKARELLAQMDLAAMATFDAK